MQARAFAREGTTVWHEAHSICGVDLPRLCQVPRSNLYIAGFPCTPFSSRRGSQRDCFDDPNALPYYAFLGEVKSGKHEAIIGEHVMGLSSSTHQSRKCLDILTAHLSEAAGDMYFWSLASRVSPHRYGEPVHRPRLFIRMVRKDKCLCSSQAEFECEMVALDHEIQALCETAPPASFTQFLRARGLGEPSPPPPVEGAGAAGAVCPCCLPFTGAAPTNERHHCMCKVCRFCPWPRSNMYKNEQ